MKVILIDKQDDQIEHAKNRLDQFVALELPELEKVESKEKGEKKEESSESNSSFEPED